MSLLVNGKAGGHVDPADRGLLYGDGLFETIAVCSGAPRFLDWHFERLAAGARRLGMPAPETGKLREEIASVAPSGQAVVKLVLTRGVGPRGYSPPARVVPTRIVSATPWPSWPAKSWQEGIRVGWCRTRLGRNPALAGLKHLNRLEQVLGRAEWDDEGPEEGLMRDDRDYAISGTQANLFARIAAAWVTPRLDQCGVAGIMRRAFLQWAAEQGTPVIERDLPATELASATALALTNALIGAWPVRDLAGKSLSPDPDVAAFNAWLARQ
jgi:4-amino-4-deoxychorismate lyase